MQSRFSRHASYFTDAGRTCVCITSFTDPGRAVLRFPRFTDHGWIAICKSSYTDPGRIVICTECMAMQAYKKTVMHQKLHVNSIKPCFDWIASGGQVKAAQ
eukprot:scaffold175588_cov15-Tisochrysis_lutea.AAC.1